MALSEREATVLGVLGSLDSAGSMTVAQLGTRTGFSAGSTRKLLRELALRGFVLESRGIPTGWRATSSGRCAIRVRGYRDYLVRVVETVDGVGA